MNEEGMGSQTMIHKQRLLLGSDHAGYHMRMTLHTQLVEENYEVIMFGGTAPQAVDYPLS